ncbi:MAG TPA: hypothetical protein VFY17_09010 [Pilimelia sp.]|nr:hypothetical protein [Pilimelia sp.]
MTWPVDSWVLWAFCAVVAVAVWGGAAWSVRRRLGALRTAALALHARLAAVEALRADLEAVAAHAAQAQTRAAQAARARTHRAGNSA